MQAGVFGEREDLLREAENRLRQEPTKYIQHIYGKQEVGGTSVLYLSAVPFEALGLPANLPHDALPGTPIACFRKYPTWSRWVGRCWLESGGSPGGGRKWRRRRKRTGNNK